MQNQPEPPDKTTSSPPRRRNAQQPSPSSSSELTHASPFNSFTSPAPPSSSALSSSAFFASFLFLPSIYSVYPYPILSPLALLCPLFPFLSVECAADASQAAVRVEWRLVNLQPRRPWRSAGHTCSKFNHNTVPFALGPTPLDCSWEHELRSFPPPQSCAIARPSSE